MLRTLLFLALIAGCTQKQPPDHHITDANGVTRTFAASRFASWNIRATANGRDCAALVIQTSMLLEDSMVEAMHYGAGSYDTYKGGLKQFTREHEFRGVAYRDVSGRVWRYDDVSQQEAEGADVCH